MKLQSVMSERLRSIGRLDCNFFVSPALGIRALIQRARGAGLSVVPLASIAKSVSQPNRARKELASLEESKAGYLRPYDVFGFLPKASQYVSIERTPNFSEVELKKGDILQTCSGRNLGPAALVDEYLAGFVVSNDMLRISIADEANRLYVWAYLNSRIGNALVRQNRTGSVIDHVSSDTVKEIEIVFPPQAEFDRIVGLARESASLIEQARLTLRALYEKFEQSLCPLPQYRLCQGWTTRSVSLMGRVDAAFYDPAMLAAKGELMSNGGVRLGDVARVYKPGGRYKTNYVTKGMGIPSLSGEQLLQLFPVNLKYMSKHVFRQLKPYQLKQHVIAFPADGRAQEDLGTPAIVSRFREGWLASGHITRIEPKNMADTAWIYLGFSMPHAQAQIKAAASGSVVDSTFAIDAERVVLPPRPSIDLSSAVDAWDNFGLAVQKMEEAMAAIEKQIGMVDEI